MTALLSAALLLLPASTPALIFTHLPLNALRRRVGWHTEPAALSRFEKARLDVCVAVLRASRSTQRSRRGEGLALRGK